MGNTPFELPATPRPCSCCSHKGLEGRTQCPLAVDESRSWTRLGDADGGRDVCSRTADAANGIIILILVFFVIYFFVFVMFLLGILKCPCPLRRRNRRMFQYLQRFHIIVAYCR